MYKMTPDSSRKTGSENLVDLINTTNISPQKEIALYMILNLPEDQISSVLDYLKKEYPSAKKSMANIHSEKVDWNNPEHYSRLY